VAHRSYHSNVAVATRASSAPALNARPSAAAAVTGLPSGTSNEMSAGRSLGMTSELPSEVNHSVRFDSQPELFAGSRSASTLSHVEAKRRIQRGEASLSCFASQSSGLRQAFAVPDGWGTRRCVWRFLEDSNSGWVALWYSRGFVMLTLFSVIFAFGQLLGTTWEGGDELKMQEPILEALFALELIVRFWSCPQRWLFWLNLFNIIDLLSVVPIVFRFLGPDLAGFTLDPFVPVLRLLKLLRRFETFHLLMSAFQVSFEALPVLLFTLFIITLTFSALIFYVEPRHNIPGWADALYLTIVTISTVGYGDSYAVSTPGKVVTSVLIIISSLYMALPIGIVGSAFSHVWEDRQRLLLLQRMRDAVVRAGFTIADIYDMFMNIDADGSGGLDLEEFSFMIRLMKIDMDQSVVSQVFDIFDDEGEGAIPFRDFLKGLFPRTYRFLKHTPKEQGGDPRPSLIAAMWRSRRKAQQTS